MPPPKPPSRDRDDRQTIKPPTRVLEQIASHKPERGDATPIESPPSKLNPDRPVDSRVVVGDLDILRGELKGWVHVDELQHEEIRKTVEQLGVAVVKIADGQREGDKNQSKVMVELGQQSLSLKALVDESTMSREKKQTLELQQSQLELARKQAEMRTQEHATIARRDLKYYVVRSIIGVLIAGATSAITLLVEHALTK